MLAAMTRGALSAPPPAGCAASAWPGICLQAMASAKTTIAAGARTLFRTRQVLARPFPVRNSVCYALSRSAPPPSATPFRAPAAVAPASRPGYIGTAMSIAALTQDAPFAARYGDRPTAPAVAGEVQAVRLGPLTLPNRYFLAPLAGVSDWPFRLLCRELGASIAHTEMISSHGLVHGGDQTLSYLERPPEERPFAIQVFGDDADVLAHGARIAVEKYGPIDAVDINMGCPVKKVCSHGAGAALLRDPLAAE